MSYVPNYACLLDLPIDKYDEQYGFKLKWRPIKNGTWNCYWFTMLNPKFFFNSSYGIKARIWAQNDEMADKLTWDSKVLRISFMFIHLELWVRYNIYLSIKP